ncbi:MAG TPA: hypothetical protein DCR14_05370 [Acidimicrobiaceae bacterium]|nr:hypothetical protein [Acidimicrobiaceae bacterium]
MQRLAAIAAIVIGVGVAAAPAAFQMFSRAPEGGTMMDEFEPYMSADVISEFRSYLATIETATDELATVRSAVGDPNFDTAYVSVAQLEAQWPTVKADMTDLLDRMDRNLDNYAAVTALPPFPMFPWFFVVPGVLIIAGGVWALRRGTSSPVRRAPWYLVAALGLGMVAAPAMFQMFSRAPQGAEMIDDFRPMMTVERVRDVQSYFITLGGGESQLRASLMPALEATGADLADYPGIAAFSSAWPAMLQDFNPMIATMRDNVDNFQAVDALPSFDLFPWFFVAPGVIVAAMAAIAVRRRADPITQE